MLKKVLLTLFVFIPVGFIAVIAAEDNKFFTHKGFDFEEIDKMLQKKARGGKVRGCSTISQQTAKTVSLSEPTDATLDINFFTIS